MQDKTLSELSSGLQSGDFSSVELTRHYLDRIKQFDADLNSYITVTEKLALQEAEEADRRRQTGESSPLLGIPIAHKDIFCSEGVRTSCGSRMLDNFIAPYDATVVEKLKAAGVVMLGKTNLDEFAMGSSNETSWYGPVKNPWDTQRVPGGSSGGSAAAVAAGLCAAATGTDTGGSIRQPAALCNLTGLKPTYGRVSRWGMIAYASSLDQGGPLARCAEDVAMLLQAMAGFDERDSTSAEQAVPDYLATLNNDLDGVKIGIPKEYFGDGLNPEVKQAIQQALSEYTRLGAETVEISLPNTGLAVSTYYVLAPAEASANLSRYDGVRYGYRCEHPVDLEDLYKRTRGEGFGAEVKRRIMIGTYVLSAGYYDAYYLKAQRIRHLIADDFNKAFEQVDVIAGPVNPTTAFKLGEKTDDPVQMYLGDVYTLPINLAGLPAIAHPAGFDSNGLPIGMQLIGNYWSEPTLLNLVHRYQQQTDWHWRSPDSGQN